MYCTYQKRAVPWTCTYVLLYLYKYTHTYGLCDPSQAGNLWARRLILWIWRVIHLLYEGTISHRRAVITHPQSTLTIGQLVNPLANDNTQVNNVNTHQVRSWLERQGSSFAPLGWPVVSKNQYVIINVAMFSFLLFPIFMAQRQIFFRAYVAKPLSSTVAPGSRPEPPYNNLKVMNFSY